MKTYDVKRTLYIKAPQQGYCVHVGDPCYRSKDKPEMIEPVYSEARNPMYVHPDPAKRIGAYAYMPEIYTRYSDDNGQTWEVRGEVRTQDYNHLEGKHSYRPGYYFDPDNGLMVAMYMSYEIYASQRNKERFSDEGLSGHTRQMWYMISRDGAESWQEPKKLIHAGREYDAEHWGPGLVHGKSGGSAGPPSIKLADGTMLSTMTINLEDGNKYQTALLRGRWTDDLSDMEWEFSDYIRISLTQSSQGACEASVIELTDKRVLVTMRACGDREEKTFPSLKFYSISEDGGRAFSEPKPLTYEDGSMVWSPSSYHTLFRSSKNGRLYILANILDEPTYDSEPRWPLCMAEIDEEKLCVISETLGIMQTLPDGLSEPLRKAANERRKGRRYSNWGWYEDSVTKELVLVMADQPNISWEDWTSDNYEYRITIPDK